MELEFQKINSMYVAEFKATSDFALHIEKEGGSLSAFVSSVEGGKYDLINEFGKHTYGNCVDYDFISVIWPKWIKIKSNVLPSVATVISEGEVVNLSQK
jgi:hypothetical protein